MTHVGARRRRATTQKLYAIDVDYDKCLKDAKSIHRCDNCFYIYKIRNCYTSLSLVDFNLNRDDYMAEPSLEKWLFNMSVGARGRWECTRGNNAIRIKEYRKM